MERSPLRARRIAKLCGADVELGNFVLGAGVQDTAPFASRALLHEIDGFAGGPRSAVAPAPGTAAAGAYDPQDWGRKFLATSAACAYLDLSHCEVATPECTSAWDQVASWHAMLRVVQRARRAASARLPRGLTIQALASNTDGRGNAWGHHLNVLVTRRAWESLFERRMHQLLFLAAHQVSSIVYAGQGKVGAENGASVVDYQLTQRGDHFETLTGPQTTYRRPIVNARDEALCGTWDATAAGRRVDAARVHVIFYDSLLCPAAAVLRTGALQIVLAMIEAEDVDPALILEDPVDALGRFGHDPALRARARTMSGRILTAVELQLCFLERAARFVADGGCDGIVPGAPEIVALWQDTLDKLRRGDDDALAGRIDWVLKRALLRRALARRPGLSWRSPEIKMLDHLYASLDPDEGLYWAAAASGTVEQAVAPERIAWLEHEPPDDTRAYGRAMLLRAAGPARVVHVDWDCVRLTRRDGGEVVCVDLPDPRRHTRAEIGDLFEGTRSLDEILAGLDVRAEAAASAADHPVAH